MATPAAAQPLALPRQGPYVQVLTGNSAAWLDVRQVGVIACDSLGTGTVLQSGPLGALRLTVGLPVDTMVRALHEALVAWEQERGQAEELGRLLALDAQQVPPGELPVAGDDLSQPWG